ncbi:MAG TPA: NRDE family protein [Candidatus Binatia bacterium]|nr:NRDE family protein [Candidatus Binatia bacterium]
MCTILLRLDPGSDEPVLLAANRDEFRRRPSDDPAQIAPGVFGGRDRQAGGTWLAVRAGGLAALTNIGGAPPRPHAPSRGELPLAALASRLPASFAPYNPFNLLVIDANGARVFTHTGKEESAGPVVLAPGLHVIVNEPFAADGGPRARHAAALLARATPGFELLASHGPPPEHSLCHHGDAYGTVSSTVVALDRQLRVSRYLHRPGLPCTTSTVDLTSAARAVAGAASRSFA